MSTQQSDKKKISPLKIEGAKIIWKNFSGAAQRYNAEGLRSFHLVIPNDLAEKLIADGWRVRWHDPREVDGEKWASLKVAVRFDKYPPRVVLISKGTKVNLDGDSIGILDDAELESVDLVVTASFWQRPNDSGYKAYLKTMYAVLSPNDLEAKYMTKKEPAQTPEDD